MRCHAVCAIFVRSKNESNNQWLPYPREVYGVMAPEVLNGQKPTVSSDIYGLTVTLWEVLHGW
jgi:hypothetical protein